jgi:hypothetical protein
VVSQPQLSALSNVEALFDNSQTFYVRVAGRDEVDLFNVSVGTKLRVTPHVFKDRGEVRIKMLVSIEDGSLSSRTVDTLPVVDRSSISTQAMIFEGESLLLGGITREASTQDTSKVPGLGSIPLIGRLFRADRSGGTRTERMILITPRLAGRPLSAMQPVGERLQAAQSAALSASAASQPQPQPQTQPQTQTPTPTPSSPPGNPPPAMPSPPKVPAAFRVQDRRGAVARYAVGERYEVEVTVPKDGFLYCYLVDGQRRVHPFFPNPGQRSAFVAAGNPMVFPGAFGFQLLAGGPASQETVACFSTAKDLGYGPLPEGSVAAGSAALRAQFSRITRGDATEFGEFVVRTP